MEETECTVLRVHTYYTIQGTLRMYRTGHSGAKAQLSALQATKGLNSHQTTARRLPQAAGFLPVEDSPDTRSLSLVCLTDYGFL